MPVNSIDIHTHTLSDLEKDRCLDGVSNVLESRSELVFAYAHGSFVRSGPFRDLDIAVFVKEDRLPDRGYLYESELERAISKAVHKAFPVDVRLLNGAPLPILYAAIRGHLLVDKQPLHRIDFVTRVIARYMDIEPILRHHAREAFSDDIR